MLFCGGFSHLQQLTGTKERPETHSETRESVGAALFPVDDTDRISDYEALVSERRHGLRESSAGRDDVLEETHQLALLEWALDPFCRAVFLGLTADDDEGQAGRHRCRGCQRDGSESRSGQPDGLRLVLSARLGEP